MALSRRELLAHLDQLLNVNDFKDYAPNGLQVEGSESIHTIVAGVTATENLIQEAIKLKADTILVHHGYFWRGDSPCVTGMLKRRLELLLHNNINLIAYHLPLDAHQTYGNNAMLAEVLSFKVDKPLNKENIGLVGTLNTPMTSYELASHVEKELNRKPMYIASEAGDSQKILSKIAWCTGAAQDLIMDAINAGAEVFLSGEVSERTTHIARELGIDYIAAGHHATERYGIQALSQHCADKFSLTCHFFDDDNPV